MSENKAYAYDPVHDEDVQVPCRRDAPHDFDVVEAVATDDPRGGDDETAQEFDRLVKADFDHDPVEACQGTETVILDATEDDTFSGCPYCGYDRADRTVHTLGGVTSVKCRRCGASRTDGSDWQRPKTDRQRRQRDKQYATDVGRMHRNNSTRHGITLFASDVGGMAEPGHDSRTYFWYQNGTKQQVRKGDVVDLVENISAEGGFTPDDRGSIVEALLLGNETSVEDLDPADRLLIAAGLLDDLGVSITPDATDDN